MAARTGYNMNSSAVKRIMQEARELANDPSTDYTAAPLEDDIFEWHCTIRGTTGSEFEGGLYHFRILLPSEYPFRPPSIMMLTPNGRFELNTKICISFTNYHEELWQPAWGVRTAIIGLQGFFPLKGTAAVGVGALEYPVAERKRLAALSRDWVCPTCQRTNLESLPDPPEENSLAASVSAAESHSHTDPHSQTDPSASHEPAPQTEGLQQPDLAERALNVLDAATATTLADPPAPPLAHAATPPVFAPKPVRPIDAASILIPADPLPPPSPPPAAPSLPLDQIQSQPLATPSAPSQQIRTRTHISDSHTRHDHAPQSPSRADTPVIVSPAHLVAVPRRPPILLDTAICVLLVLVFGLICRRVL